MRTTIRFRHLGLLALTAGFVACGSDDDKKAAPGFTCGDGTHADGTTCVASPSNVGPGGNDGGTPEGAAPDGAIPGTPPTFAGVTSVAPAGTTSLQITWNAAQDAVSSADKISYNIYIATSAGAQNFSTPTATAPPGSTSLLLNTVTANTTYYVVVRAVNEAKLEDKNTAEQNAKAQADSTVPTFAGATGAEAAPGSSLKVSWTAATDDLTPGPGMTYLVYLSQSSGGQDLSGPSYVSDVGATSIVIKALTKPDTTYYAVVRARDAAGNLDTNVVEVSGKTGTDTAAPTFAGCTSATTKDAASVTLSWNAATDDTTPGTEIVYDVFASKTAGGQDFTTPTASFTNATLGVVAGLSQASQYYFVCRARDLSGNSDQNKSERTATTLADGDPPTFAGATGISNITSTSVQLNWAAGSDTQTPTGEIVYDVYQASSSGGQAFTGAPVASSDPGASSVTVSDLTPATQYYFVVRARDKAGNHDTNVIEKNAVTKVSFLQNVAPIFLAHCAVSGCHVPGTPPYGLVLIPAPVAYANLYNVTVGEAPAYKRVVPSDPTNSYLWKKINPSPPVGEQMPPAVAADTLSASEKTIIQSWIQQGAEQN
jgi:hypothetical protein